MYIKINRSRQLALDGVVDVDMDYTSNDTGSSPTYYLLFSSVFFLLLFNALSHNTPVMYFEWRWQSDFGVSILVTTLPKWMAQWSDIKIKDRNVALVSTPKFNKFKFYTKTVLILPNDEFYHHIVSCEIE